MCEQRQSQLDDRRRWQGRVAAQASARTESCKASDQAHGDLGGAATLHRCQPRCSSRRPANRDGRRTSQAPRSTMPALTARAERAEARATRARSVGLGSPGSLGERVDGFHSTFGLSTEAKRTCPTPLSVPAAAPPADREVRSDVQSGGKIQEGGLGGRQLPKQLQKASGRLEDFVANIARAARTSITSSPCARRRTCAWPAG